MKNSVRSTPARTGRIAAGGLALVLALAGCSLIPYPTNQGGGNGPGTGSDSQQHATLPATFPKEDVPLVGDDYAFSLTVSEDSWGVFVRVDDPQAGFAKAGELLISAGFEKNTDIGGEQDGVSIGLFTSEKYTVQLMASHDKQFGSVVDYTVVRKAAN